MILKVLVEKDGRVSQATVRDAPKPDYGMIRAARRAVRRWRYRPAKLEGKPVSVYITVVIRFELDDADPASSRRASHQRRSDS